MSNQAPRRLRTLLVLTLVSTLLAACGRAPGGRPSGGGAGSSGPAEVVIGLDADIRGLEPLRPLDATTTRVLRNVYESLFFRTPEGRLQPWLAESAEMQGDSWLIRLRQGIAFHNGEHLDADAVKANLDYILDPAHEAQTRTLLTGVTAVEAVDDHTLRIRTESPNPDLPAQLTDVLIAAPGPLASGGPDALSAEPAGTGPFKVEAWEKDQRLVLVANPDYWRGRPAIERVVFRVIPDTQSRLSALLAGEVHLIPGVPPEAMETVRSNSNTRIESVPGRQVIYVGFNLTQPGPLQDRRVRQALNHAVDVQKIIDTILNGFATRTAAGLIPVNAAYDPGIEPYPYDPDKARALLAEAGYGQGLTLDFHAPQGRYLKDYEVAQEIARQLEQVGVRTRLQTREWGSYLDDVRSRRISGLYLLGLSDRYMTGAQLDYLFHGGRTWVTFQDPEVDAAIEAALAETDPERRRQAFTRVQRLVRDYAPWIFLWQQHDVYGVSRRLQWQPRVDQQLFMFDAKLTQP